MVTCSDCGEIFPDIVDGDTTSERARAVLSQCQERQRCARCLESYKKTTTLCHEALKSDNPDPKEGERLLALLRDKLGEGH